LKDINSYQASLNLIALTENSNNDYLVEQLAKHFKGQPCINSTGYDTEPGTKQQSALERYHICWGWYC
jgi:hypothetical protein